MFEIVKARADNENDMFRDYGRRQVRHHGADAAQACVQPARDPPAAQVRVRAALGNEEEEVRNVGRSIACKPKKKAHCAGFARPRAGWTSKTTTQREQHASFAFFCCFARELVIEARARPAVMVERDGAGTRAASPSLFTPHAIISLGFARVCVTTRWRIDYYGEQGMLSSGCALEKTHTHMRARAHDD